MLGLHQVYVLTSLSTTQTRALPASSLMLRRVRLDSRLVHRVRAITKSRPRMALPEFVARSVAVCSTLRLPPHADSSCSEHALRSDEKNIERSVPNRVYPGVFHRPSRVLQPIC